MRFPLSKEKEQLKYIKYWQVKKKFKLTGFSRFSLLEPVVEEKVDH